MISIILIFCLGSILYSNTLFCSFHFDDSYFIVDNFAIRNIQHLQGIWHYFHGRFITLLSLALNYHFSGLNVFGYHLFNLAVHLVSACLVWWLVLLTFSTPAMKEERITQHASIIALFAGLVFVSHPVQIEAVTYIWQRAASMAALFYLASLCLYVKSRLLQSQNQGSGQGRYYYIGSLITAVVAMFTKENTVTLPLMILFYEFTFLRIVKVARTHPNEFEAIGPFWKNISPFLLTVFIVPITFLFIKSQTFQSMHGELRLPGGVITPMHYFLTQFRVMFTYIRLVFLPLHQNLDYDYPIYKSIFELPVLVSLLFLIAVFYGAIRLFSKYRLLSFSVFWFFLTLIIPESSFWAMGDVILEHRLYLPLVGYSIFLVSGVYYLWGKDNMKAMVIALSLIIAFNSVLTYQRNKVWKDEFTLWDDVIHKSPHKARPYTSRGSAYYNQGNFTQSMPDFDKAIEIDPSYADAYYDRGLVFYSQGNFVQAFSDWNKTIEINPDYVDVYSDRGLVYYNQGKFAQAISDYNRAIEIEPDHPEPYINRALVYYQLKEYGKAWEDVHKAEKLGGFVKPGFINALKRATDV